jgi:GxxExxY protein
VHNQLGNGFQELIYQRALAIEFKSQQIAFVREKEIPIYYQEVEIGTRRVDFLIEGVFLLEIKALIKLEDIHLAQTINYCHAYKMPTALLINFGSTKLQFKRVFNLNKSYIK